MKKSDKAEDLIRSMLNDRYSIISACRWTDKEYDLKTQYATIEGGFEVSIYYCRLGNIVRKAKVFRCGIDGGQLKKAKKSFLDDFLINFLEQCG